MITGRLVNSYPSKKNRSVMMFVFALFFSGATAAADKAAYKESKGEFYQEDEDGNPLYWTSRPSGKTIQLKVTTNNNMVEDTTDLDIAAATAERYKGSPVGAAIAAQAVAQHFAGQSMVATPVVTTVNEKLED